jgi:hypothetical protein
VKSPVLLLGPSLAAVLEIDGPRLDGPRMDGCGELVVLGGVP